jgi:hypothetical protein
MIYDIKKFGVHQLMLHHDFDQALLLHALKEKKRKEWNRKDKK